MIQLDPQPSGDHASLQLDLSSSEAIELIASGGDQDLLYLQNIVVLQSGLPIYSWRARTSLPCVIHDCEQLETFGEGIGQPFRLNTAKASITLVLPDALIQPGNQIFIEYHYGPSSALPSQPVRYVQRGAHSQEIDALFDRAQATSKSKQRSSRTSSENPADVAYRSWREYNGQLPKNEQQLISEYLTNLATKPKISIIMPIYHPNLKYLQLAIKSVIAQLYTDFELVLSIDGPQSSEHDMALSTIAESDQRIKIVRLSEHGNISVATTNAANHATGDFLAFMDQDDELTPDALAWFVAYLNQNPHGKLFYSDEDKVFDDGGLREVFFKPDFAPEMLLSMNYFNHLTIIERQLFITIGGLRTGYEGSQDWEMILRATASLDYSEVIHIPWVLYHWRVHQESVASGYEAKPYVYEAQERLLSEHLERSGYKVSHLERPREGRVFLVPHLMPTQQHLVSIIVPTKNNFADLSNLVHSIESANCENYELIVVENQSSEPNMLAYLEELRKRYRVIAYDVDFNFATMMNFAALQATGDLLLFLNDDTQVITPDWLDQLSALAERGEIGAVGAKLIYSNAQVQHAGVVMGLGGVANHANIGVPFASAGKGSRNLTYGNYSAVTGAVMMVKRSDFIQLHGFDPRLAISFNDVDFCLRLLEAGKRNLLIPSVLLYHHESRSRGRSRARGQLLREDLESSWLYHLHAPLVEADPFYSPNFSQLMSQAFLPATTRHAQRPWLPEGSQYLLPTPHESLIESLIELGAGDTFSTNIQLPQAIKATERISIFVDNPHNVAGTLSIEIGGSKPCEVTIPARRRSYAASVDVNSSPTELIPISITNPNQVPIFLACLALPLLGVDSPDYQPTTLRARIETPANPGSSCRPILVRERSV